MRLIDADAFDDVVSMLNGKGRGITRHEYKVMESVLFAFPTIDAVEVVRCGDCLHKYMKDFDMFCPHMVGIIKPNMHCSYGESEGE